MAALSVIQAAQDAVYATLGVAAVWTPAGGSPVPCTALVEGGDQAARIRSMVGEFNLSARIVKVRARELAAVSASAPLSGDAFSLGVDIDTPADQQTAFLITGDPRQADPRRLEWTIELDPAPV